MWVNMCARMCISMCREIIYNVFKCECISKMIMWYHLIASGWEPYYEPFLSRLLILPSCSMILLFPSPLSPYSTPICTQYFIRTLQITLARLLTCLYEVFPVLLIRYPLIITSILLYRYLNILNIQTKACIGIIIP